MDNQHKLIKGYRDLSQDEINLMNSIKQTAENVGDMIDVLASIPGVDLRWVNIAKTHLQQGFMAATRAVAQPNSF